MVNIVKGIVDFALFKEFVTPVFLKILYLIFFIVLNVGGLLLIGVYLVLGVLAFVTALNGGNATNGVFALVVMLIMAVILVIMLIIYNLLIRMYFEVVLLMFNIHGYLKSIDDKTSAGRK